MENKMHTVNHKQTQPYGSAAATVLV